MARIEPDHYQPDTAVPPGLTIEELIAERPDRDDDRTARALDLTPDDFRALLRGDHEITPDLAARLAAEFPEASIPAYVWENLDLDYRATLHSLANRRRNWTLAEVFPAGEYIREELEARGIAEADFAAALRLTPDDGAALLGGDLPLTTDMARRVADIFGTSAQVWVNCERGYRDRLAGIA